MKTPQKEAEPHYMCQNVANLFKAAVDGTLKESPNSISYLKL